SSATSRQRIRAGLLVAVALLLAAPAMAAVCGNHVVEVGETCDDGNTLPGDCCSPACQFESNGTVCRSAAGNCDVVETCTGASGTCPADIVQPSTVVCRSAAGICDQAET